MPKSRTRDISIATMTRIRDTWKGGVSLRENMIAAGLNAKVERVMRKYKAQTEDHFGIMLPSQHPQFSRRHKIKCPSTLDHNAAKKCKTFVITSAVNNCNLVDEFLATLENFCDEYDAQLLIVPLRYRNPSAMTQNNDVKWDSRIYPYAMTKDILVNKYFMVSRFPLQATAVNPLQGMSANSGARSAIYGHPQIALETVPTPSDEDPKLVMTTGAITRKNYSDSKAGGQAVFNHTLAATFVKVIGSRIYTAQLHWNGKGFYLYDKHFGVEYDKHKGNKMALVMGDEHVECTEPVIQRARGRVLKRVEPEILVRHDVIDFKWQSHHATRFEKIKMAQEGDFLVKKAFDMCVDHVNKTGKGRLNLFAGSNHNDHPDQWLNKFNPDRDPHNAPFAYELTLQKLETGLPAFDGYVGPRLKVPHKFLDRNSSYKINGIDVSQHGDVGGNGARGSAKGFSKFATKTVIGHSHSPKIEKGCYQVGVSTKDLDYAKGYSSWAYADCIIYPDGKRCMVFYTKGKSLIDYI